MNDKKQELSTAKTMFESGDIDDITDDNLFELLDELEKEIKRRKLKY